MSRILQDLPSKWKLRKLDSIAQDIKSGFASGKRDENGIVQLRMNNVDVGGKINLEKTLKVPIPKNIADYLLRNGDVLFNNTNSVDLIGKTSIFNDEIIPCTYSNHLTRIRGDSTKVDQKWILYYLISLWRKGIFYRICNRHVGQAGITSKEIVKIKIPVPPLVEQRGIVEVLGTVDECIRLTDAVIERAEELKRGLMQQLLTRGIRHTEYTETPLGEIPKIWKTSNLHNLVKIIDCKHYTPEYVEEGIPIIRTNDIKSKYLKFEGVNYVSEESYKDLTSRHIPRRGDIVYSREGTFGVASLATTDDLFCIGQRVVILTPKDVNPHFLFFMLNSQIIYNQVLRSSLGTTARRINVKEIQTLKIPTPQIKEQNEISSILHIQENALLFEEKKKTSLIEIKKGLIQLLLSGKTRVELKGDGLHRIRDSREANN